MRISKSLMSIIAFLVLFSIGNAVLSFVLRPFSGPGKEMWDGLNAKDNLDMVFVGSSQCMCDINPEIVQENTGLISYNMGTNMQSIQSSYIAIKEAVNRKNVGTVVLLIDPETMEMKRSDNFRAEQCFMRNLSDTLPIYTRFRTTLEFMCSEDFFAKPYSISYLVPWTYDRTSNISLNLKEKINGQILDTEGHRDENGYSPSDVVYSIDVEQTRAEDAMKWSLEAGDLHVLSPNRDNLDTLEDIAQFCHEKNVTLYVVTVPALNTFTYYDYFAYVEFTEAIKETLLKYGLTYYDFNLIKEEYFDTIYVPNYRDIGHMNNDGSTAFSGVMGTFLNKTMAGEDVTYLFKDLLNNEK